MEPPESAKDLRMLLQNVEVLASNRHDIVVKHVDVMNAFEELINAITEAGQNELGMLTAETDDEVESIIDYWETML